MLEKKSWKSSTAKTITFIVTKDCQLACKYCYVVGKNKDEKMDFDTAKKTVDYIFENQHIFNNDSVVFDFIGGEPLLEIRLIDQICDYIKEQLYIRNHKWFSSYRISISTNGINYDKIEVQKFIEKNILHLSIGISIDGTKDKHDLNRIYSNGQGSYDDVVKNIKLWLEQFPTASTKVTVSSLDLKHIKDSVLHLYSLGIKEVNINCVFENVWNHGDDLIFESQLKELADAIYSKKLYENYSCSFFNDSIGKPLSRAYNNENWCGAGVMLAVDSKGLFYPCNRFAKFSLRNKEPIIIGDVEHGINFNKLRPFLSLDRCTQSNDECINCNVASGCAWCQAENYDSANSDTIYQRSIAICKMHKARVRANEYYWSLINKH